MQKFTSIEDFREGLDIEICATLERDFNIEDIEISFLNGTAANQEFMDSITPEENAKILTAIQDADIYTGH